MKTTRTRLRHVSLRNPLIAVALCAAFTLLAPTRAAAHAAIWQTPPPNADAALDEYPPVRNTTLVHFFSIEGDVKLELLRKAIVELGTADAEAHMLFGPAQTPSIPGRSFLAVEAPAALKSADVARTVRRGASGVDALVWMSFTGLVTEATADASAGGSTSRDAVLGLSNDVRWVDTLTGRYQFYCAPGKLTAAAVQDRLGKWLEGQGTKNSGKLIRESFTWRITSALDAAQSKRIEKALEKLDGVALARADVSAKTLRVEFDLDGMRVSAPPTKAERKKRASEAESIGRSTASEPPVHARFDVNPVLDLLAKEKVTVAALEKSDANGGGKVPEKPPSGG